MPLLYTILSFYLKKKNKKGIGFGPFLLQGPRGTYGVQFSYAFVMAQRVNFQIFFCNDGVKGRNKRDEDVKDRNAGVIKSNGYYPRQDLLMDHQQHCQD